MSLKLHHEYVDHVDPASKVIPLNASLLKQSFCDFNMYLKTICGLQLKQTPDIPQFGTALHKFCAVADINGDLGTAMNEALKLCPNNPKSKAILMALMSSRQPMPRPALTKDGSLFVEQELFIPWRRYTGLDETTQTPFDFTICLWARPDLVCVVNDVVVLFDYKTSLYYKTEDALRKYDYEIQFEFYKWLLYQYGHLYLQTSIANLARQFKLVSKVVIAQCGSEKGIKWTMGPPVGFTQQKADIMLELIENFVEDKLIPLQLASYIPQNEMLTNSCARCDFSAPCHAYDGSTRDLLMDSLYTKKTYGPSSLSVEEL